MTVKITLNVSCWHLLVPVTVSKLTLDSTEMATLANCQYIKPIYPANFNIMSNSVSVSERAGHKAP